ncbi:glycosyltransferase [Polaribacter sp. HaHaR_3_91]|uniref:glycosyltransferase n=1 Tax=Polaribacter sp. HaHaR_3_91 TaxID=2745561 RepID=UPI001C4EFE13|nr:glycosyltransferase [Polaribacter sp. HaHaR_3_91]QXP65004.1 glycosyltransferase [Polaribacter sp. HaHaR_3_91]
MKFAIITHTLHKRKNEKLFAYEPYVREMNLWLENVSETRIVAPISEEKMKAIEVAYKGSNIHLKEIPSFNVLSLKTKLVSIFKIPFILIQIIKACFWADHIHLRCPGNVGLLGCFVQILFPSKPKTVKYAGNWDPKSKQPVSYRIQKWIISNTFLTKNCKVLVYGEWENQSKNIVPFFTASYVNDEIIEVPKKDFSSKINFIFVGAFTEGKQPLLSVKVIEKLLANNIKAQLNMYGHGGEFLKVQEYVEQNNLEDNIILHGNQSKEVVKKGFQKAHFLIFISKSEGWPKVVAEAMFWSCLPISSKVSCIESMLGSGTRGTIVESNVKENEIVTVIENYIKNKDGYQKQVLEAKKWSQQYTLEKFSSEIKKILLNA